MKKSELLNWLQKEYQNWEAFLDQIGPTRMDQPAVNGEWSMKDVVAHLTGWNRWLVARLQAAQHSEPEPSPPWPEHLKTDDEINEWIYKSNCQRPVSEVLDEMHDVFQQFISVIEGLPEDILIEPAYHILRLGSQRFSASEFFDHFHDDHEPDIRAWLARGEKL
jgi:hypothetical protein